MAEMSWGKAYLATQFRVPSFWFFPYFFYDVLEERMSLYVVDIIGNPTREMLVLKKRVSKRVANGFISLLRG